MSITLFFFFFLSGVIVGFIHTLSAGGTTLTIALYLAMGLPPQTTNAVNRVGVIIQNLFATSIFAHKKMIDFKKIIPYALATMCGAFLGSLMAVKIDEKVFSFCMGGVLLIMIFILFHKRKPKEITSQTQKIPFKIYLLRIAAFMGAGFYGGFIQVGTGFLLIGALTTLLGYDLVKTNAHKVFIMFCYTLVALGIFAFRGGIETRYWIYGLVHALGNIVGAFIATKYALKRGEGFVRVVILVVIVLAALNLFGILNI